MDNIEYKSRVGALQNALFYLKDQCDEHFHLRQTIYYRNKLESE